MEVEVVDGPLAQLGAFGHAGVIAVARGEAEGGCGSGGAGEEEGKEALHCGDVELAGV